MWTGVFVSTKAAKARAVECVSLTKASQRVLDSWHPWSKWTKKARRQQPRHQHQKGSTKSKCIAEVLVRSKLRSAPSRSRTSKNHSARRQETAHAWQDTSKPPRGGEIALDTRWHVGRVLRA